MNSCKRNPSHKYEMEVPSIEVEPHLLISSVRQFYLDAIIKNLSENYVWWCGEKPPQAVWGAAHDLELQAAAHAMVMPLYRHAVCSMLASIKKCTLNKDLYPKFQDFCIKSEQYHKSTQTEPLDFIKGESVASKDYHLEKQSKTNGHVVSQVTPCSEDNLDSVLSPIINNPSESLPNGKKNRQASLSFSDDEVMKEMEELFKSDNIDTEDTDIFGESTNDMQIKLIMEEINRFGQNKFETQSSSESAPELLKLENTHGIQTEPQGVVSLNSVHIHGEAVMNSYPNAKKEEEKTDENTITNEEQPSVSLDARLSGMLDIRVPEVEKPIKEQYVYSPWPCELFYQKRKLRIKLDTISDRSFRKHAKVKDLFEELFGFESDDEQGLQSPDTSQEFLRSCRQRAAPCVVKHLQKYALRASLPESLFKPLARHLLYQLVQHNQYPDDYGVYIFIKEYFKNHPRIRHPNDF